MSFKIHTIESAPEASKESLQNIKDKYGFIPNIMGEFAESPAILKSYLDMGTNLNKLGNLSNEEQFILFTTVSVEHGCSYCKTAHTAGAKGQNLDADLIEAVRNQEKLSDEKLEAFRQYVLSIYKNKGNVDDKAKEAFIDAGYGPREALEIILGMSMKLITNYTNSLAGTEVDPQFEKAAASADKKAA